MSRPTSAMMTRARSGLMPGISASRATAFSAGASGPAHRDDAERVFTA